MPTDREQATLYHSINFTKEVNGSVVGKNTWYDWRLIPSSRPVVAEAALSEKYVDIAGRDGQLDISDWPAGLHYQDRVGSWEFYVTNNRGSAYFPDWEDLRTEISNFLDGSIFTVVLDDDPGYHFTGRCRLTAWKSEANFSKIDISYHFEPYKIRDSTGDKLL